MKIMLAIHEDPQGAVISHAQRRTMLFILCIIYTLNYLDRQVVAILQEPIKAEFHL